MRVGVLTGGGDCPGLNAVIRAVVRKGVGVYGYDFIGFRDGWRGPLEGNGSALDVKSVRGILPRGGTILNSSRTNPLNVEGGVQLIKDNLRNFRVEALIAIGGEDTLGVATKLNEQGLQVVGVPKTIDNDLEATATTFGFDSAVAVVMDALDRVHTTATSHRRVMVVEVMGRHAGWIALHGGIAGGADIILIPEIPFDYDKIASAVKAREAAGYLGTVVVVAEGARPKHGQQVKRDVEGGEFRLGGIGEIVAHEIAQRTGKETRCCVLGHLQRGGAPTTLDRILGTRFGVKAVQLANEGHFGSMVSYQNYQVRQVPIAEAVNRLKLVPPNGEMVQTARDVDISFGD
jgi:6-phosphofructokinase 1